MRMVGDISLSLWDIMSNETKLHHSVMFVNGRERVFIFYPNKREIRLRAGTSQPKR